MTVATPGPLLFARYAYPPNALGLCGADRPRTLLEYGAARACDPGLAEVARSFDGAWPYLTLIAHSNRIADPLDARVVEAYWVGNGLLDQVSADDLARHVEQRFHRRIGRAEQHVLAAVAGGAVPHHCFHVFAVYPWLGLLRTGIVEQPLHILDQCRTTPALVQSCHEDGSLTVLARPLRWHEGMLSLGEPSAREVRWRSDGLAFGDPPLPGERVSLHWDFVCDRLTEVSARALLQANRVAIAAVNRAGTVAALA
jgi:hypothetical protein